MPGYPLVLADQERLEQFALLGNTRRLFQDHMTWKDILGVPWAGNRVGGHCFAVTWLGPGWIFDAYACQQRAEDLAARRQAMSQANAAQHAHELAQVLGQ